MVGMAYALARTTRLKVGTSVAVLPGRHPVLVAKQLASLAALAPKRVLPGLRFAFGDSGRAGSVRGSGRRAGSGVRRVAAGAALGAGRRFGQLLVAGISRSTRPRSTPRPSPPLDIWLGGSAPAAFRRIGTLADGWLGSFLTPDEARAGREAIQRAAEQAGRQIEPDHFGISLAVADGELSAELAAAVRRRRPGRRSGELIAAGWDQLHRQLDAYLDAGLTKFVIRPAGSADWTVSSIGSSPSWSAGRTDRTPSRGQVSSKLHNGWNDGHPACRRGHRPTRG